jgi:hypothetical protein
MLLVTPRGGERAIERGEVEGRVGRLLLLALVMLLLEKESGVLGEGFGRGGILSTEALESARAVIRARPNSERSRSVQILKSLLAVRNDPAMFVRGDRQESQDEGPSERGERTNLLHATIIPSRFR